MGIFPLTVQLIKNDAELSIILKLDCCDQPTKCLIDTAASCSLIKQSIVKANWELDDQNIFMIEGSNKNTFSTYGTVFTLAYLKRKLFPIFLQVVDDDTFPDPNKVVIGLDMLKNCEINIESGTLTINNSNDKILANNLPNKFLRLSEYLNERQKTLIQSLVITQLELIDTRR